MVGHWSNCNQIEEKSLSNSNQNDRVENASHQRTGIYENVSEKTLQLKEDRITGKTNQWDELFFECSEWNQFRFNIYCLPLVIWMGIGRSINMLKNMI